MITKIATPGVYIDEISTMPPSVAEVESAIPAFVGYTEFETYKNIPQKVTSMADFILLFGGGPPEDESKVEILVDKKKLAGIDVFTVDIKIKEVSKNILWYAMKHFFDNGGSSCYVLSVGKYSTPIEKDLADAIPLLEDYDEPTMLLCPEASRLDDVTISNNVMNLMVKQAQKMKDRIALVDVFDTTDEVGKSKSQLITKDIDDFRSSIDTTLEKGRYAAAYYPNLETTYQYNFDFDALVVKTYTENSGVPDPNSDTKVANGAVLKSLIGSVVYNAVRTAFNKKHVTLPPSAAIAGIISSVDSTRGYWKAPANVNLSNVVQPSIILSNNQQEALNIDPNFGKSVNVIRQFPGQGNVVWGARTLEGNNNEWRYVNVRRFFMVVEESIKKSINWAVFEPNTAQTWVLVQSMIENYLFLKWRDGALAGTKPEDAYYVKVGINKTMTPQDILEGKMIVEIGMAVARPAEFIILNFIQMMQKS